MLGLHYSLAGVIVKVWIKEIKHYCNIVVQVIAKGRSGYYHLLLNRYSDGKSIYDTIWNTLAIENH